MSVDPPEWSLFRVTVQLHASAYNTGVLPIRLEFDDVPKDTPEYAALMLLWGSWYERVKKRANEEAGGPQDLLPF